MLVPPMPWTRYNRGGYFTLRTMLLRVWGTSDHLDLLRAADQQAAEGKGPGLTRLYEALNILGSQSWCGAHACASICHARNVPA